MLPRKGPEGEKEVGISILPASLTAAFGYGKARRDSLGAHFCALKSLRKV